MSFFSQLSFILWMAFLIFASVRIVITLKDSRIFRPKN